jgi:DNA mismatch repair ATPase MutS
VQIVTIDDITLADLEILGTRAGSSGLFGLVDHAQTTAGRRNLRQRLTAPLADVSDVSTAR